MRIQYRRRWPIATALFVTFCSQGPAPSPSSPSAAAATVGALDGRVSASAVGDVKVGTGALEMDRLRMDRQSSPGVSVVRQYANPGGTYGMNPGETIELWAEYPAGVAFPRFRVEWGDGSVDATGCGSCLLTHRYPNAGIYTVTASLDDRVSTTVTRTFRLDARPATAAGPGVLLTTVCGFPPPQVFAGGDCSFNTAAFANYWCQLGGYSGAVSYTEVSSGAFQSLYYDGGPDGNGVLNSCAQVGSGNYGFGPQCTGVINLRCAN